MAASGASFPQPLLAWRADASAASGPCSSTWLLAPDPLRKRASCLVSYSLCLRPQVLPSPVHLPEGSHGRVSPNLGLPWDVGLARPKSGCPGSLVGVGFGQGRKDTSDRLPGFQSCVPHFAQTEFSVVRYHEEFIWLHNAYVENEEYAGLIVRRGRPGHPGEAGRLGQALGCG